MCSPSEMHAVLRPTVFPAVLGMLSVVLSPKLCHQWVEAVHPERSLYSGSACLQTLVKAGVQNFRPLFEKWVGVTERPFKFVFTNISVAILSSFKFTFHPVLLSSCLTGLNL